MVKRGDKIIISILIIAVLVLSLVFVSAGVFQDLTQGDFNGTYVNTSYNGNGIILNGTNLTGTYTSRIFDGTGIVRWDNLSWIGNLSSIEYLFAVDNSKSVYFSNNSGINWSVKTSDYGGGLDTTEILSDVNYLYIIFNGGKEILRSENKGVDWNVINSTLNQYTSGNWLAAGLDIFGNLYIIDGAQGVWLSNNRGVSWISKGDFNVGYSNDIKGFGSDSDGILYVIDGGKRVYSSSDNGTNWNLKTSDYGGTTSIQHLEADSNNNLYVLQGKNVYKSNNSGVNWSIVNSSFTSYSQDGGYMASDNLGRVYILDNNGRIFISYNNGTSWNEIGDINSATTNTPKGFTNLFLSTNLTLQVKNCSLADCSDGSFINADLNNINLTGRYFQYKVDFTSQDLGISPKLYNVSLDYTILDNTPPLVNIISPLARNYTSQTIEFNVSLNEEGSSCLYSLDNWQTNNTMTKLNNTYFYDLKSISDGSYISRFSCADSFGNINDTESRSFIVDSTAPVINIDFPLEQIYSYNTSLALNYSVLDFSAISSCWYKIYNSSLDLIIPTKNLTDCQNTTFSLPSGDIGYTLYLYANDSMGNLGISTRNFSVSTTLAIVLLKPENNKWISYNNLEFNYSVNTAADILNCSLWGNFSGEWKLNMTNSSLVNASGGINKFFLNLTDGNYLWNIECYTGAYHGFGFVNYTINIDSHIPVLNIESPMNNSIFWQNISIDLNFTVADANLQSCWYSLNNGILNRTINNCVNGINNITFSYPNGTYNLSVYANDSANNLALYRIYNFTIEYDSIAPNLNLIEPKGTPPYTSLTNIPLTFITNDSDKIDRCYYNLSYSDGTLYRVNTEIANCTNTNFSVGIDKTSYIIHLSSLDRTGNINISSSNFTVSTSSTPVSPPSGGGGGGSGGGSSISGGNVSKGKLSISGIGDIVAKAGDKKTLSLNAKNIGKIFLNNCKLVVNGDISSWIYSIGISGIAPGENKNFVFDLNVPEGIEERDYSGKISIVCDEGSAEQDIAVSIPKGLQSIKIKEIKQEKNNLNIVYTYEGGAGNINTEIWMLNKDNVEYKRVKDSFSADGVVERNVAIDIPEDLTGIYSINLALSSDLSNPVKQSVVLGKSSTTGFSILDQSGNKLIAYIVFVLIILVGILFIVFWNRKPKRIKTKIKVRE